MPHRRCGMRSCELAQPACWWWRPRATRARPGPSTLPPFPRPSRSEQQRRARVSPAYSSFGGWLKFAAPECAPVTAIGGGTDVGCATSVASPLVAGIVGLLRTQAPFATADELESALGRTARPIPGSRHGLVDAAARARRARAAGAAPATGGRRRAGRRRVARGVLGRVVGCRAHGGIPMGALPELVRADRRSDLYPLRGHARRRRVRASGHGFLRRDEPDDLGFDRARRRGTRGSRASLDRRSRAGGNLADRAARNLVGHRSSLRDFLAPVPGRVHRDQGGSEVPSTSRGSRLQAQSGGAGFELGGIGLGAQQGDRRRSLSRSTRSRGTGPRAPR